MLQLPKRRARRLALLALAAFFVVAGVNHFVNPDFYVRIMPPYLPVHLELVYLSGFFEILGGIAVLVPGVRALAGWGLILLLLAVYPANLHMALHPELFPEISGFALYARLPLQLLFVAWAYWATRSEVSAVAGSRSDVQASPEEILDFWFADAVGDPAKAMQRRLFWFQADPAVDESISQRFSDTLRCAARGELRAWEQAPRSCLALIILLDQFPRNLYRGGAEAFQNDSRALGVASRGVAAGYLDQLSAVEQCLFVLPYEHSEDVSIQRAGVGQLAQIVEGADAEWKPFVRVSLDFARQHLAIVERFGRFPHRNAALGRPSTPAEQAYMEGGGESFGQ